MRASGLASEQPDPVHLVEPVGHAGNAAAQSYRQITAIHRTSAGDLRHPDVDGSRCIRALNLCTLSVGQRQADFRMWTW